MSERDLQAAFKTEIAKEEIRAAILVWLDFPSGSVRFHTGTGSLSYDSHTWDGAGKALSFTSFPETTDGGAQGVTVDISGADADCLQDVLNDPFQGHDAEIHMVLFDSSNAIIEGQLLFKGRMDTGSIRITGQGESVASIGIENKLIDQVRPVVWRYNSEDQKKLHPLYTDKAFDFIPTIQDLSLTWGPTDN